MGFIPAIAGAASSIIGAVGGRGGGGAARVDYAKVNEGQKDLGNIFNYTTPFAKSQIDYGTAATKSGKESLDAVTQYWKSILSGDRPAVMAAVAPEINTINDMYAGQRESESAYGTGRGGGTAEANRQAESQRLTDISKALFTARPQAAAGIESAATSTANIGLQQMSTALRALGLSEDAVKAIIGSAMGNRKTSADINANTMDAIGASIASGVDLFSKVYDKYSGGGGDNNYSDLPIV